MAVILNGTDQYISVPDSASLRSPSTELTIAAWWRSPTADGDSFTALIGKIVSTSNPWFSWQLSRRGSARIYHGAVTTGVSGSYEATADTASALAADTWHFGVFRFASGTQMRVDIFDTSGSLVVSAVSGGTVTLTIGYSAEPLVMGTNETQSAFWAGHLAGVYVHDSRLTDPQVADLLADTLEVTTGGVGSPAITPSGGYWPLDFNARDTSGNGNHGSQVNDPEFTESFALVQKWTPQAVSAQGANQVTGPATTAGSFLHATVSIRDNTDTVSVSDSVNGTWSVVPAVAQSGSTGDVGTYRHFYVFNAGSVDEISVTRDTGGTTGHAFVREFSGSIDTLLDHQAQTNPAQLDQPPAEVTVPGHALVVGSLGLHTTNREFTLQNTTEFASLNTLEAGTLETVNAYGEPPAGTWGPDWDITSGSAADCGAITSAFGTSSGTVGVAGSGTGFGGGFGTAAPVKAGGGTGSGVAAGFGAVTAAKQASGVSTAAGGAYGSAAVSTLRFTRAAAFAGGRGGASAAKTGAGSGGGFAGGYGRQSPLQVITPALGPVTVRSTTARVATRSTTRAVNSR